MFAKQRLALLDEIQRGNAGAKSWLDVGRTVASAIQRCPCGIAFVMVYNLDPMRPRLTLVGAAGIVEGHPAAPASMALDGNAVWPVVEVLRTRAPVTLLRFDASSGLEEHVGIDGARPASAYVLPLARVEADGVLIVGFDEAAISEPETTQFLTLLAGQLSAGVAHAFLAYNRTAFQTLADSAPAAIFIKDRKSHYVFANPLTRTMLKCDDLVGRTDGDVLPAETAARLRADDVRVMDDAESIQREERLDDRTFLMIKFPWRGPDGKTVGLYGVAIDITERKRIEDELRRTEKKYRAIGESINYGVWVGDATGQNMFASESFLSLTGMSQQEFSDSGLGSVLHPDDADATMRAWQACVDSGSFWSREHRVKGTDGRYHHVLARGVPVRDDSGVIERWVGINLDIHQIKDAEQQLRDADRRKDQFLSMLAHELCNPLVPIRNSLHLLHASGLATAAQRDAYDMMARQVENLVRLVNDMLDLGRIAQRKLALRPRRIDLAGLVDAAIEIAQPHIDKSNCEVLVQLPDEPVFFNADPDRLTQVLGNLLINSATYTPAGGRVELRARRLDDALEVTVTDNGVAALPDLHRSAADTLARYDDGARFTEGVGIGLALVKDLIEMHGGAVVAVPASVGIAGTVGIRIPIGSAPAGPSVVSHAESAART